MAMIKRRYYSSIRPYRDRPDVVVTGRWHWCPPGAKIIPYFHLFSSYNCESEQHRIVPPIGEIPKSQGSVRARDNPRYLGQNWCGSEETWTKGALYSQRGTPAVDVDGVPRCCRSGPPNPGGVAAAGEASFKAGKGKLAEFVFALDVDIALSLPDRLEVNVPCRMSLTLTPLAKAPVEVSLGYAIDFALKPVQPPAIAIAIGFAVDFPADPVAPEAVRANAGVALDLDLAPPPT